MPAVLRAVFLALPLFLLARLEQHGNRSREYRRADRAQRTQHHRRSLRPDVRCRSGGRSHAECSQRFDYPNPTIPTSLDLADFQSHTVFFRFLDSDEGGPVKSFQYSGTITSLDPAFFFDSLAACGAIPGEGVELCGDVAAGGAFFGQQVLDSEIDTTAAAVLANLQTGDTAQIWDLSLDGVLTGDGQLTFAYKPELLGAADESDIRIARYDAALEQWVALPTLSLDMVLDTITVQTTGFSLFAVTLPEPIGTLLGELQSPVPTSLGDILFTADGATAWVIGDSEGSSSTISTVPVLRDGSNRVEGFGSPVVRLSRSSIDTGLEFAPGTDVVFYTYASAASELSIGQRRADGMTREEVISTASANGGMVFIPSGPHAGNLLVSEYDTGLIKRFDVSPDGNGFFDLVEIATVGDLDLAGSLGDIEFVPSGPFAGQLLVANYSNSRVELYDIDLMTLAISPESTLFFARAAGPWGLEFDPLTDDLFVADYDAGADETAIWRVPEPGAGAAGLAALGALWLLHRRRRPC